MAPLRQELFFAVRWPVIGRYFGQFCLIIALLNLVTLTVALLDGQFLIALCYALIVLGLFGGGWLLTRVKATDRIQMNEAMSLVALVFLVIPLVTALPLTVSGIPFPDALFETISAATTTGLSTLGPVEERPLTFAFARAWMQWYGGLGIVVFSLALIVRPGVSARKLSDMDLPDDLAGGTRAHARRVLIVYAILTVGSLLLWVVLGGAPLQGLLYTLSAVSTGGFAPTSGSFADLAGLRLAWTVTLATLAGALPLALYYRASRKGWREFLYSLEVRTLLAAGMGITLLLGANLWLRGMDLSGVLRHAPLMALSAQTTSGFSSLTAGDLDAASKAILIVAMATGGSVGSTAGGFKILRLLILFGLFYRYLKTLSMPPDAVVDQRLGKRRIDAEEIHEALMIILIFIGVVFISWFMFLAYGYPALDGLFEVVSATGTVGLSSGLTQAGLPVPLKLTLCADMLMGRLEFLAWLVFFYHRTWFGRKRGS